jgi:hypothetical protein
MASSPSSFATNPITPVPARAVNVPGGCDNGNGNGSSTHGQAQGSVAQLDLSTIDVNALNAAQQQALAAFLQLT